MNTKVLYILLMLGVMTVACEKEMEEPMHGSDSNLIFSVCSSEVKSTLDPTSLQITWNKDDKIAIWASGTDKYTILTSQSSGAEGNFVGDKGNIDIDKDLYAIYPASSIKMLPSDKSFYQLINYSEQSGLISDFGKYNVSFSGKLTKESEGEKVVLSNSSKLSNLFAILKFSIKDGLDVQTISIEGFDDEDNPTGIAGCIDFNPFDVLIKDASSENTIQIKRSEVINGDVYVFISPNHKDSKLINTATKLRFTFRNTENKVCEYTNLLKTPLASGVLTDLGSVNVLRFREEGLYVVSGGEKWAKLSQKKDIIAGSALDFSSISVDAPAGKYGNLKAVDTHFEFTNLPGTHQYFYGANLTTTACAPDKSTSNLLAARLARIGYNSVRIHHFDDLWELNEVDANGDSFRDRMDYFIYSAINNGLYVTLDLYSNRKVASEDLGLTSGQTLSGHAYKVLAIASAALANDSSADNSGHLGVYKDWCRFTDSVLEHVNPYTGRKYSEEPALIMLSVINEPSHSNAWNNNEIYNYTLIKYAWEKCHGFLGKIFPPSTQSVGSDMWESFVKWIQTNGYANMVQYCKTKGYQGLQTVAYDSRCYIDNASGFSSLDIHDSHAYVDHPTGDLPNREIDGLHPLSSGLPQYADINSHDYTQLYNRRNNVPITLSEWNHCTPNHLRALGSMLGSAYMRSAGWDGIWRFAYAQGYHNLFEDTTPGSFDVSKDEVMKASEAAVVSFYLRGDVTDPYSQLQYSDTEFSVITDKSIALYKEDMGAKTAGILSADTRLYPATIFVTSMDNVNISESDRILLVNMTDCAGNGATYTDETKRVTMTYGTGQYVRISESDISLALSNPSSYKVYELDTNGNRKSEIMTTIIDGKLCFTISVRGVDNGAHLYYEIVR